MTRVYFTHYRARPVLVGVEITPILCTAVALWSEGRWHCLTLVEVESGALVPLAELSPERHLDLQIALGFQRLDDQRATVRPEAA